jgi:hypothetical protein
VQTCNLLLLSADLDLLPLNADLEFIAFGCKLGIYADLEFIAFELLFVLRLGIYCF